MTHVTARSKIAFLYVITNIETAQYYVGVSVTPNKRWYQHKWLALRGGSDQLLHRAMRKHGIHAFSFEVIACSKTWSDAILAERDLIRQFGSFVAAGGYNLTYGGEGPMGRSCSDTTRQKISRANRGKPGRENSDMEKNEARLRLIERWQNDPEQFSQGCSAGGKSHTGRKHKPETIRKMKESALRRWSNRLSEPAPDSSILRPLRRARLVGAAMTEQQTSPIRWARDPNSHRIVAFCGVVAVGAVFDIPVHGRYIRWRAWVTVRSTPVEGTTATVAAARSAVEERFDTFLKVAGLTRANPEGEAP